jgi:hypothetical protein
VARARAADQQKRERSKRERRETLEEEIVPRGGFR